MTVQEQEIARYVERVRQALADLPPAVRDELVEDLPEHLTEVAAEGTGSLVDRLGPPEAYAAELRDAVGAGARPTAPNLDDRISAAVVKVRGRLRQLDSKTGPIIGYAKASDFLRLLRPAWWVLFGFFAMLSFSSRAYGYAEYEPVYNPDPYSNVRDVYVYDQQGRLVEGARLFDQDGTPIRLGHPWCPEARLLLSNGDDPARQAYPYCP